jgi:putative heme iron utilization protein
MTLSQPGASSPSFEPSPPPYDALAEAKLLLRTVRAGALATVTQSGAPFASLVNVATMPDGSPVFLSSRLSAHTRQLERDPRMSLLLAQGGEGDPLSHPRLTVSGSVERADAADRRLALRARFLARHPKSALYADFGDFSFWRVSIETAHLNGGFGRVGNFQGAAIATAVDGAGPLIAAEADALAHINADHADALALYAAAIAGKPAGEWRASGIDPEGLDLICGDDTARILFPQPVESPQGLRTTLRELAALAREMPTIPQQA